MEGTPGWLYDLGLRSGLDCIAIFHVANWMVDQTLVIMEKRGFAVFVEIACMTFVRTRKNGQDDTMTVASVGLVNFQCV